MGGGRLGPSVGGGETQRDVIVTNLILGLIILALMAGMLYYLTDVEWLLNVMVGLLTVAVLGTCTSSVITLTGG